MQSSTKTNPAGENKRGLKSFIVRNISKESYLGMRNAVYC
jgi:hypothetical protein